MAIEYNIDTSDGIIYEKFKGVITVEEVIAHIKRQKLDPLYRAGMPTLADLSEVVGDWSYMQINQLRNFAKDECAVDGRVVRWAVVAPTEAAKSVVRVFSLMNEALGIKIEVMSFNDKTQALAWVRQK